MKNFREVKGIVFDLKKFAIHDGRGIRSTVFLKGCPLSCAWCHNPESQKLEPEEIVKTLRRKCLDLSYSESKEVIGREVTVAEIMKEIEKDIPYFDESNGGVTFSGGEPLMQPEFLFALLHESKELDLHTAVDTTGYATKKVLTGILPLVDTFLYDLKLMDKKEHIKYAGVDNNIILDNLKYLAKTDKHVNIRIPIIPTITDTKKNLNAIMKFLLPLKSIRDISLLPFNKFGEEKQKKMNVISLTEGITPPTDKRMKEIKKMFDEKGFNVKIGG